MLPKGSHYFLPTSFDGLTQEDVDLMMSHINSYVRESANDKTPYDLMTRKFGVEFADLFNIRRIPANDKDNYFDKFGKTKCQIGKGKCPPKVKCP